jgi:predicted nucleotidyltransferase
MSVIAPPLALPLAEIEALCQRWHIRELALFGSQSRSDARPDSDIDLLVSFDPGEEWDLIDMAHLREELAGLLGGDVDLLEIESVRNPYRLRSIERDKQVVYAAG